MEALKQFHTDVLLCNDLVLASLAHQFRCVTGIENHEFTANVRETDDNVYLLETNLTKNPALTSMQSREIGRKALFGVADLNLRIEEMQWHNALAGFIPEDAFMFTKKIDLLVRQDEPNPQDRRFERVLTVANLPQPDYNQSDIRIDSGKLLSARSSPECVEFREWLRTSDGYTDEQIHKMVNGLRTRLTECVNAPIGKTLRILLVAGLGTNFVRSAVWGAIDGFLLDRLLPRSGPAAFLSRKYPSIFQSAPVDEQ